MAPSDFEEFLVERTVIGGVCLAIARKYHSGGQWARKLLEGLEQIGPWSRPARSVPGHVIVQRALRTAGRGRKRGCFTLYRVVAEARS